MTTISHHETILVDAHSSNSLHDEVKYLKDPDFLYNRQQGGVEAGITTITPSSC